MSSTKRDIFKKFGSSLVQSGHKMLRKAFDLDGKKKEVDARKVRNDIRDSTDMAPNKIYLSDRKYDTISWEDWKELIEYDWIDKRKYIDEMLDCDNFSHIFSGHMQEIYELNTAGMAHGIHLVDPDDGSHIGYHRANVIYTKEGNLYLFEPMTDEFTLMESTSPVIGDWQYDFDNWISMN